MTGRVEGEKSAMLTESARDAGTRRRTLSRSDRPFSLAPRYCDLMPDSRITAPHLSISAFR